MYTPQQTMKYLERTGKLPQASNKPRRANKLYSLIWLPTGEVMVLNKPYAVCSSKRKQMCQMARYKTEQFSIK